MFENLECKDLPKDSKSGWMAYGSRPIYWIVDNGQRSIVFGRVAEDPVTNEDIAGITKVGECQLSEFFPWFMSEIKSLYIIPDDPRVTTNAVKIYLYTHTRFSTESNKGLRRTYFQGFNQASTFKTEDYSIIPPMTDFRRTIWWQPDIITDAQGKAKVEFFNNSTCEEMYISVEGMTPDGKVLVNE